MSLHPEQLAERLLKPSKKIQAKLYAGDCNDVLADMDANSVHFVLTDPPYGIDGLDHKWSKGEDRSTGAINGLPVGMKFDAKQGIELQRFMEPIAKHLHRVLVPGGFAVVFSSPRLFHRMAIAFENVGFEIRDQYAWHYTYRSQFKAFTLNHFIAKDAELTEKEKEAKIKLLKERRTPQLRPQFESILCAQKARDGTFINNWIEHGVGLIDVKATLTGKTPATVMRVEKPLKERYNNHLTPKPVRICEHLIRLFTQKNQIVLDPFVGSGTTCVAAYKVGRYSIGIDMKREYIDIAKQRIEEFALDKT